MSDLIDFNFTTFQNHLNHKLQLYYLEVVGIQNQMAQMAQYVQLYLYLKLNHLNHFNDNRNLLINRFCIQMSRLYRYLERHMDHYELTCNKKV